MKQTFPVIFVENQDHVAEGNQNYLILPVHFHYLIRNWVGNVGMSGKSLALNTHWYRLPHTHNKVSYTPKCEGKEGEGKNILYGVRRTFLPLKNNIAATGAKQRRLCPGIDFLIRNTKTLNRFTFQKQHHLTQWHQRHAKVWKEQERGKMFTRV